MNKQQNEYLQKLRHSAEHVLEYAMKLLYGDKIKMAMGPAIDTGFYFDFDKDDSFEVSKDMFDEIEQKMQQIIDKDLKFDQVFVSEDIARKLFSNNPYKQELIDEIKNSDEKISLYLLGSKEDIEHDKNILEKEDGFDKAKLKTFIDLCKGPHIDSTKEIKAFKLLSIAGAYWRGDEKNKMLTRIYGTAFSDKKDLDLYLESLEYAKKYNHRKIGKEMELFAIIDEVGQGLPIWLPNGYAMRRAIEEYMFKLERLNGYVHILTPHLNKSILFETSGHLKFYKDSMYPPIKFDDEEYYVKPMNCPAGMMVYKLKKHSYRDLPLKLGEMGTVYRYEKSGELHGLQRVRGFTQNDAHIFCTKEQLEEQFMEVVKLLKLFYKDIGFKKYKFRLSLSDEKSDKYVGSKEEWKQAEDALRQVLIKHNLEFEEAKGEAAFYGPKLDVQAVNVFGKEDTISTVQVDFNLPKRFDITYIDKDGKEKRPFVIHRALIGSYERFFAFLIEYHKGDFPVWFAPIQVAILPIADRHKEFAKALSSFFYMKNLRVMVNDRSETLNAKIRDAEIKKIPYIIVVGDKELSSYKLSVRDRKNKTNKLLTPNEFVQEVYQNYPALLQEDVKFAFSEK